MASLSTKSVSPEWLTELLIDEWQFFIDGWDEAMTCVKHIKQFISKPTLPWTVLDSTGQLPQSPSYS